MTTPKPRGRPADPDILTPAEWQVVEAVRHGLTNRDIAERRGISLDAVKYHVSNALTKLGLSRRTQLKRWDGTALKSAIHSRKTETDMTLGPIGQIARGVSDIAAARQ